ncbi:MAG TPA: DUF2934 domain-containing protein [Povalibacter sp.]|uniref:DUF2934 domain-containing protein n=1 Tax=Povalibacter sp. TaxID=1962978 RepID=UPI002BC62922|nr:DUF2934 domain-containing protein [Povalibacter sp.]HMN47182.1 DUF2934 domain-containing protein [Povalibacter sp.]
MQVSPATQSSTAKAKRSKATAVSADATGATKPARTRKKAASAEPASPPVEVVALHPSPEDMTGMIATAAYFIAAERHFAGGHELDDWLEAERRVRAQFPSS